MRVFCDFHHDDLYYSLQLLFEKRLGWEMYRPIGLDWYHEGFWCVYPHPATAEQFLGLNQGTSIPLDGEGVPLPEKDCVNRDYTIEDGIYYIRNSTKKNVIQRAVTLSKFKDMKFDVVLSSVPQHIDMYNRLIALYQPAAKHIFQVGNAWGGNFPVRNILSSTVPHPGGVASETNICFYHQEFDTSVFNFTPPSNKITVDSYIHFMQRKDLMNIVANLLPSWTFRSYGAGMEDSIGLTDDIAKTMKASGWTWHYKPEGDGYGHVLHNSFACGRPVIIDSRHYNGKLGSALLQHGRTCLDLAQCGENPHAIVTTLQQLSLRHTEMCIATRSRFDQIVNFDYEFEYILKPFLERLI